MGSPRKSGNSDTLLDQALAGANSLDIATEKIYLCDLNYSPCIACDKCLNTGICAVEDDMGIIYDKISEASGLILSAPIYFHSIPAQVKAMIDRFQCKWAERFVVKKHAPTARPAGFIAVGGRTQPRFELAQPVVKIFFGMAGFQYISELLVPNRDNQGFAGDDPELLRRAFTLGVHVAEKCRAKERS